eukprot:7081317-Pyramimonas_sp.AAC.1
MTVTGENSVAREPGAIEASRMPKGAHAGPKTPTPVPSFVVLGDLWRRARVEIGSTSGASCVEHVHPPLLSSVAFRLKDTRSASIQVYMQRSPPLSNTRSADIMARRSPRVHAAPMGR